MADDKFWRKLTGGTTLGTAMLLTQMGDAQEPPPMKDAPPIVRKMEEAPPPRRVEDNASKPGDKEAEKKAVLHCMDIIRNCQLENGAIDIRSEWDPKDKEQQDIAREEYKVNKAAWEKAQAKIKLKEGEKAPEYPAFDPKKKDSIRVVSYFSNWGAMAMLGGYEHHTKDQRDLEVVSKWLDFYNKKQSAVTGIVPDQHGSRTNPENKIHDSDQVDSIDAYASTHLQLLDRYTRLVDKCDPLNKVKCEKIAAPEANLKAAKRSLKAIESCLKEDGLTVARSKVGDIEEYPVKFLMDNIEVYAGLVAGERYFSRAGADVEAKRCKEIYTKLGTELKKYWQADEKHFAWAIQNNIEGVRSFDTGLDEPYPHGMANQFGIVWVANGKEQKELWTQMQKDFKLNPDDHKVFDEAMPIARSYMASVMLKDGNSERWRKTLLKQMEEMPGHRNIHIVGIAALAAMEQQRWMDNVIDGPIAAEKKGPAK